MKTSNIPNIPCFTGSLVSEQACAIEPVPRPASFENMPLDTPFFMLKKKLPTIPPVTAEGLKAPSNIETKTEGTEPIFNIITPKAMII